jgi:hypothetical protein
MRTNERNLLGARTIDLEVVGKLATRGEIGDEQLAAIKNADSSLAGLHEKIWQAKTEEIEACRAYYLHVRQHDCV